MGGRVIHEGDGGVILRVQGGGGGVGGHLQQRVGPLVFYCAALPRFQRSWILSFLLDLYMYMSQGGGDMLELNSLKFPLPRILNIVLPRGCRGH